MYNITYKFNEDENRIEFNIGREDGMEMTQEDRDRSGKSLRRRYDYMASSKILASIDIKKSEYNKVKYFQENCQAFLRFKKTSISDLSKNEFSILDKIAKYLVSKNITIKSSNHMNPDLISQRKTAEKEEEIVEMESAHEIFDISNNLKFSAEVNNDFESSGSDTQYSDEDKNKKKTKRYQTLFSYDFFNEEKSDTATEYSNDESSKTSENEECLTAANDEIITSSSEDENLVDDVRDISSQPLRLFKDSVNPYKRKSEGAMPLALDSKRQKI